MNELSICPLGKMQVNCLKSLKKPSICLPGKTPSAPSARHPAVSNRHLYRIFRLGSRPLVSADAHASTLVRLHPTRWSLSSVPLLRLHVRLLRLSALDFCWLLSTRPLRFSSSVFNTPSSAASTAAWTFGSTFRMLTRFYPTALYKYSTVPRTS